MKKTVNLSSVSRVKWVPPVFPAVTLVAVRRWASAEDSPLHEQARADKVGESLEPGGALQGVKSEVARCDGSAPGSTKRRADPCYDTVRLRFAQNLTKKHTRG